MRILILALILLIRSAVAQEEELDFQSYSEIRSYYEPEILELIEQLEGIRVYDGTKYRFDLALDDTQLYYMKNGQNIRIDKAISTDEKVDIEKDLDEELGPQSLAEAIFAIKHLVNSLRITEGSYQNGEVKSYDIRKFLNSEVTYDISSAIEREKDARFYFAPETLTEEEIEELGTPTHNITDPETAQCPQGTGLPRYSGMDNTNTGDFLIHYKGLRDDIEAPDPYRALLGSNQLITLHSKESVEIEPLCGSSFMLMYAVLKVQGASKVKFTYYFDDENKQPVIIEIVPSNRGDFTTIPLTPVPRNPITQIRFKVTTSDANVTALVKDIAIEACCPDWNDGGSNTNSRTKRNIKRDRTEWKWPLRYTIRDHDSNGVEVIESAIQHWEDNTCLRFTRKTKQWVRWGINFRTWKNDDSGFCGQSPVARVTGLFTSGNRINIKTSARCLSVGLVIHEIAHSLGFYHEHTRPDRDDFLIVNMQIIPDEDKHNYEKHTEGHVNTRGIGYDLASVMHYGTDGERMVLRDSKMFYTVGQLKELSFRDAKLANFEWCGKACGDSSLEWELCQNEGYRDPNCCGRCKCPPGWRGVYCEDLDTEHICGPPFLKASSSVQTLKYEIANGEVNCAWRISAPGGFNVHAKFIGDFEMEKPEKGACFNTYVEIRYNLESEIGARQCGNERPSDTYRSKESTMVVLSKITDKTERQKFTLEYWTEPCGLCEFPSSSPERPCIKIVHATCLQKYTTKCGFLWTQRCTRRRYYRCYRSQPECCTGRISRGKCDVGCGGCDDTSVWNQPSCRSQGQAPGSSGRFCCNQFGLTENDSRCRRLT